MKTENESASYSHILKYTGLFGGVQGLSIAITLVRNKVVALLLGPVGMGLVSLFNVSINFISQATNLGISFSAVRHLSEIFDEGDERRIAHYVAVVRCWSLLVAFVGMVLMAMLAPWLSDNIFAWGDHTLHFVLLSPAVAMTALTGCETAILKGARQLRPLAAIQLWSILAALVIAVPVYWLFGMAGIVPVLVVTSFTLMVITMRVSLRSYPFTFKGCLNRRLLGEGRDMVRLGVSFVLAGIMGSGAEMVIRSYLNVTGDLDAVGLYNAGYMLVVTYAGMVFSAMETDYFPRISAVNHDNAAINHLANMQVEVSLLVVGPMLASLIVLLPLLLPLLFSVKFLPVVPMAQVAVLSMYLKAFSLPVAYITLAKGHSIAYFVLEAAFDVAMVIFVIFGYQRLGLLGTGVALVVAYLFDWASVCAYAHVRYGYTPSRQVMAAAAIQMPLGVAAYGSTLLGSALASWVAGIALALCSVAISAYIIIYKKTSLWKALKNKYLRP